MIKVIKVMTGDCTDGKTCPALARSDRGTWVVVGKIVTDPEALGALGIGPGEQAVEVPAGLLGER